MSQRHDLSQSSPLVALTSIHMVMHWLYVMCKWVGMWCSVSKEWCRPEGKNKHHVIQICKLDFHGMDVIWWHSLYCTVVFYLQYFFIISQNQETTRWHHSRMEFYFLKENKREKQKKGKNIFIDEAHRDTSFFSLCHIYLYDYMINTYKFLVW